MSNEKPRNPPPTPEPSNGEPLRKSEAEKPKGMILESPFIKNCYLNFEKSITLDGKVKLDPATSFQMIQAFYAGFSASMAFNVAIGIHPKEEIEELRNDIKAELAHFSHRNREICKKMDIPHAKVKY